MVKKIHSHYLTLLILFNVLLFTGCQEEPLRYAEEPGITPAVCTDCATTTGTNTTNPEPCGDLIISRLEIGPIVNNKFYYTLEFKNIGMGTVFIKAARLGDTDVPVFQTYRSKDNVGLDLPAGGATVLRTSSDITLLPNQTYTTKFVSNLNANVTLQEYPYFIVVIENIKFETNDCNLADNTFVRYLLPILGHF